MFLFDFYYTVYVDRSPGLDALGLRGERPAPLQAAARGNISCDTTQSTILSYHIL